MANLRKPVGKAVGHPRHAGAPKSLVLASAAPPPDPPKGLLRSSRRRWFAFWTSEVARAVDRESDLGRLERWIRQVDEYERAAGVFKTARLVKGSTGQPTLNPLASYLAQLDAMISRAETDYGMTPMARLKLGIALGEAHKSLSEMNAELEAGDDDDDQERLAVVKELHHK